MQDSAYFPRAFAALALALTFAPVVARAQEDPADLGQARLAFQRDVEFALRPIRDRYVARLEGIKRSLGSRGDARGAVAVQDEIDRVRSSVPDAGIAKFLGSWKITFTNGETRHYIISLDSTVIYDEQSGKRLDPPIKGKLTIKGSEGLLDFQGGGIERIKMSGKNFLIEQFAAKDGSPNGPPVAKGIGTTSSATKE